MSAFSWQNKTMKIINVYFRRFCRLYNASFKMQRYFFNRSTNKNVMQILMYVYKIFLEDWKIFKVNENGFTSFCGLCFKSLKKYLKKSSKEKVRRNFEGTQNSRKEREVLFALINIFIAIWFNWQFWKFAFFQKCTSVMYSTLFWKKSVNIHFYMG